MPTGRCHCGAIRYEVRGDPAYSALCHCQDCRRHAGAPVVAWTAYAEGAFRLVQGEPKTYASSKNGRRQFCPECGTSLFYRNAAALPGLIDIQTATFDDPAAVAPQIQVQVAERLPWMASAHELPVFERYPSRS